MNKNNSVAVVIPVYKDRFSRYEEISFYHNIEILRNRDIYILGPKRLTNYLNKLAKSIPNIKVYIVEDYYFDNSHKGNSRLNMSKDYYEPFKDYTYILTCHIDAFVFKDELDYWMSLGFDSIGAPIYSFGKLRKGNNGGLGLRKVTSFLKVLNEKRFYFSRLDHLWMSESSFSWKVFRTIRDGMIYNYKWKPLRPVIKEDIFWTEIVPMNHSWFNVADFKHNALFAFERNSEILFEVNNGKYPMGIHGWWKYEKDFHFELIKGYNHKCYCLLSSVMSDECLSEEEKNMETLISNE